MSLVVVSTFVLELVVRDHFDNTPCQIPVVDGATGDTLVAVEPASASGTDAMVVV